MTGQNAPAHRRIIPAGELAARALDLSREPARERSASSLETGLVVLRLGREWYGVPAGLVQEVAGSPEITPVPMTPPFVAGVLNLRGELVGVLDLAVLFGLPAAAGAAARRPAVVVRLQGLTAALLADAVLEVEWFAAADREPVLPTLPAEAAGFLAGVMRDGGRLVMELNIEKILAHPPLAALRGETAGEERI